MANQNIQAQPALRKCTVDGCGDNALGHGLCRKHYKCDWARRKKENRNPRNICSVDGCEQAIKAHSFCENHRYRFVKYGDPLSGRTPNGAMQKWIEDNSTYQGTDCLIWPFASHKNGYAFLTFNKKRIGAHAAILTVAKGNKPSPQHEAAHLCGNGHLGCVAPSHLEWKTHKENEADKRIHNTLAVGSNTYFAKLKENEVINIFNRASAGERPSILAKEFCISQIHVRRIKNKQTWSWLTSSL